MSGSTNQKEIDALLSRLDGSGSDDEWAAATQLRALGSQLPQHLLRRLRTARNWKARSSCVCHAIRYAPDSESAVALGLEAIRDRSKVVRYRGGMLLAFAQAKQAVPALRAALEALGDAPGAEDLLAAIDAIEGDNPNYFVDRDHSGKVTLTIG